MRCSKCGTESGEGDVFCPECGIRVTGDAGEKPVTTAPEAAAAENETGVGATDVTAPPPAGAVKAKRVIPPPPIPPPPPATPTTDSTPTVAPPPLPPAPKRPMPVGKPRTSGMAVASLIVGIFGMLFIIPVISPVLAIIFGAIAKREVRRGEGKVKGSGMACAGITLGIVALVILLIAALVMVPIGIWYFVPTYRALDHLERGVEAARTYYFENNDSYSGMNAVELNDIDDTLDWRSAPGNRPDVVYVDEVSDRGARLYVVTSRGRKIIAAGRGNTWRLTYRRVGDEFEQMIEDMEDWETPSDWW